jgi:hypothetical protein
VLFQHPRIDGNVIYGNAVGIAVRPAPDMTMAWDFPQRHLRQRSKDRALPLYKAPYGASRCRVSRSRCSAVGRRAVAKAKDFSAMILPAPDRLRPKVLLVKILAAIEPVRALARASERGGSETAIRRRLAVGRAIRANLGEASRRRSDADAALADIAFVLAARQAEDDAALADVGVATTAGEAVVATSDAEGNGKFSLAVDASKFAALPVSFTATLTSPDGATMIPKGGLPAPGAAIPRRGPRTWDRAGITCGWQRCGELLRPADRIRSVWYRTRCTPPRAPFRARRQAYARRAR